MSRASGLEFECGRWQKASPLFGSDCYLSMVSSANGGPAHKKAKNLWLVTLNGDGAASGWRPLTVVQLKSSQ